MRFCMGAGLGKNASYCSRERYRGFYQFNLDGWKKGENFPLWVKFCFVFIGSIFLTGGFSLKMILFGQKFEPQTKSLCYWINLDGNFLGAPFPWGTPN
ncbi:MAG: hypothetical protein CM15mP51_25470 [Porticoccaceae bacterium]|nr:MAG: hypothetical protein CM15mP51_25470 [Porticoccaceae bacterium]